MGFGPSHVQLPSPKAGSEDGFFGRTHVESIHLSASNSLKGSVVCCSICLCFSTQRRFQFEAYTILIIPYFAGGLI